MHVNKVAPAKLAIVTMGRNAALLDTWPRLVGYALSLRWRHELDVQNLRKLRLRKPSTEKELAACPACARRHAWSSAFGFSTRA